ncbi:hypothetical protein M2E15_2902 [Bacillus mycoides]|nr:hypothetical protein M2E15_2902 [Bacillus mycoides]
MNKNNSLGMYQNIYWIEIMFIGFYQLQDERSKPFRYWIS